MIVDAATERRLLGLLGLGLRSRGAILGVERVRDAAKRGRLAAAVVAPDASKHSRDKLLPLLAARKVPVLEGPNAAALGAACGREATAVVGIVDHDLARGVRALAVATVVSERVSTKRGRTGRRTA